jgi:sec-independent protein translocase protein TatA
MFQNIGFQELIVILVIILIIFGPKNLPKIGQALGKSLREFKNATRNISEDTESSEGETKKQPSDSGDKNE